MATRMARAIANRMAEPMRSAWQKDAPNPNPNPNPTTSLLTFRFGDRTNRQIVTFRTARASATFDTCEAVNA